MAGKSSYENPWADPWDSDNEEEAPPQGQQAQGKDGKKLTKKLGQSFSKTKEGASKGMKKVKDGASVSLFWIKDKCRNKKPPNPTSS